MHHSDSAFSAVPHSRYSTFTFKFDAFERELSSYTFDYRTIQLRWISEASTRPNFLCCPKWLSSTRELVLVVCQLNHFSAVLGFS